MRSYDNRGPCFLAEPGWRRLSRDLAQHPSLQSTLSDEREEMFQKFVDLPGFIHPAVDYIDGLRQSAAKLQELVRQGHLYRSKYEMLQQRTSNALKDADQGLTKTASSQNDKLFPVVYQFSSVFIGSFYCGYWATMSMLNTLLIGLEAKLHTATANPTPVSAVALDLGILLGGPDKNPYFGRVMKNLHENSSPEVLLSLAQNDGRVDPELASPKDYPTMSAEDTLKRRNIYMEGNIHHAREICRCVEKMSTSEALMAPLSLVYALRGAIRILKLPEEKAWIMHKLHLLSKQFGIARTEAELYCRNVCNGPKRWNMLNSLTI